MNINYNLVMYFGRTMALMRVKNYLINWILTSIISMVFTVRNPINLNSYTCPITIQNMLRTLIPFKTGIEAGFTFVFKIWSALLYMENLAKFVTKTFWIFLCTINISRKVQNSKKQIMIPNTVLKSKIILWNKYSFINSSMGRYW